MDEKNVEETWAYFHSWANITEYALENPKVYMRTVLQGKFYYIEITYYSETNIA